MYHRWGRTLLVLTRHLQEKGCRLPHGPLLPAGWQVLVTVLSGCYWQRKGWAPASFPPSSLCRCSSSDCSVLSVVLVGYMDILIPQLMHWLCEKEDSAFSREHSSQEHAARGVAACQPAPAKPSPQLPPTHPLPAFSHCTAASSYPAGCCCRRLKQSFWSWDFIKTSQSLLLFWLGSDSRLLSCCFRWLLGFFGAENFWKYEPWAFRN